MAVFELADLTWKDLAALDLGRAVAILPVGATEAHGPHLPLATDCIIARAMAEAGAARLAARGFEVVLMPHLPYTAAPFARAFPGTTTIRPETAAALLVDLGTSLAAQGFGALAIANAHLDPAHLGSLHQAAGELRRRAELAVAFPDVTSRAFARRLTAEFKSGACHAGQYEGSIVLAARPELVREAVRATLSANPSSLSAAIREGKNNFHEAGGPEAYFGDPAAATAAEGRETIALLGEMLEEAVLEVLDRSGHPLVPCSP